MACALSAARTSLRRSSTSIARKALRSSMERACPFGIIANPLERTHAHQRLLTPPRNRAALGRCRAADHGEIISSGNRRLTSTRAWAALERRVLAQLSVECSPSDDRRVRREVAINLDPGVAGHALDDREQLGFIGHSSDLSRRVHQWHFAPNALLRLWTLTCCVTSPRACGQPRLRGCWHSSVLMLTAPVSVLRATPHERARSVIAAQVRRSSVTAASNTASRERH